MPGAPGTTDGKAGGARTAAEGWLAASVKAGVLLVLSFLGFVLVPDRLATYLADRARPAAHDAAVLAWVVLSFAVLAWLFVRFQRREAD